MDELDSFDDLDALEDLDARSDSIDSEAMTRIANQLRLSARTVREVAKRCPGDMKRMQAVAREAEIMAAELENIGSSVNIVPFLRPRLC